jgi:hypothetical protein
VPDAVLDPFLRPFLGAPAVLALDAGPRPPRRTEDGRPVGAAVRPSAGVRAAYGARLRRLVDEMHVSIVYWLSAAYGREEGRIATLAGDSIAPYIGGEGGSDVSHSVVERVPLPPLGTQSDPSLMAMDTPSTEIGIVIRRLRRRWLARFADASQDLARYFAKAVYRRNRDELGRILRQAGMTVELRVGRHVQDVLGAIVHENVSLIRSIPEQYLTQVEGSVMRSVLAGRDQASLVADLQQQHGVVRRRAEFIALHQNNSASNMIQRVQFLDMGIERAIWRHSHAGRVPRPSHVANDGKEYDVRDGWFDPHEQKYITPGQLPNCRCFSQPILPR